MKFLIVFVCAIVCSLLLISCEQSDSTATVKREQANVTASPNNSNLQSGTEKISVQQNGNSTNVTINKGGEKNVTVTAGNSTVEIGKSGISVKSSGESQASEQTALSKGKTITIDSNRETRTINCDGGEVNVNGNRNTLTVRGGCTINVNGNDNIVSADSVREISTPGNNNKVTWSKGVDGKKPEISNTGSDNVISQTN